MVICNSLAWRIFADAPGFWWKMLIYPILKKNWAWGGGWRASRDSFSLKCHRHAVQQAALLPDRVSISFKSVVGFGAFPVSRRRLLLFKREGGGVERGGF